MANPPLRFVKTAISQQAREYVVSLGRDQVTSRQKHVLMAIAENYSDRYGMTVMDLDSLCEYVLVGRRQIRRILQDLCGFVEYIPGRGSGNFGRFKLRGLAAEGDIKGVQRGHKEDISDSPNKEEDLNLNPDQNQNCAVAGFDMAVDSEVQSNENKVQIVSSSSSETADDDTKLPSQSLIDRILQAFEQSPITTGKVKITDRITARELLSRFTSDEIEYGIVLAGARRTTSLLCGNDSCRAKVQTLAYFSNAIQEATEDPNMSASYLQYLRHSLRRNVEMMAHLEEDAQMYGKKEPQRVAG